jgi:hypothetical protein
MNADGMVSGERCNCEGQLAAEAALARLRSEIEQMANRWLEISGRPNRPTGFRLCADELLAALARGGE